MRCSRSRWGIPLAFLLGSGPHVACFAQIGSSPSQIVELTISPRANLGPIQHIAQPQSTSGSATSTTLALSSASVEAGTAVTLTAKVASGKTAVAPGIVLFCNLAFPACAGEGQMAQAVLNTQGKATRTLILPAGAYSIAARFEGTSPYTAS